MRSAVFSFILIPVIAVAISACNYTRMKNGGDSGNDAFGTLDPNEKATAMNYTFIAENILKPKCISCHGNSGGVNLESYESVLSQQHKIHQSVFVEHTMPKKGALSDAEMRLLWHWLDMGCPKESENGGSGTPIPDPLKPTFDSINSHIFQVKCVTCHSPGQSAKRIPLTKDFILNSPLELALPGNPDESGLVIAVERTDEKRMPLAKEGYGPLSDEEKKTIREWISNGASD
jgi:uncharacterized membrane protein